MSLSSSNLLVYPLLLHIVSASSPTHLLVLGGWGASRWQIWSLINTLLDENLILENTLFYLIYHISFFISYFEGWSPNEGLSHNNLPSLSRSMKESKVRSLNLKVWAPCSKVNVVDGNIFACYLNSCDQVNISVCHNPEQVEFTKKTEKYLLYQFETVIDFNYI